MTKFEDRIERQHRRELRQQVADLDGDGRLSRDEKRAFQDSLKKEHQDIKSKHDKTDDGYAKSEYSRGKLETDEQKHGYAPSTSVKRFTGSDADVPPYARADSKFRFDKSDLTPEGKRAVSDVSAEINRIKRENGGHLPGGVQITVHGHTDSIGDADYNQELSARRAQAAKDEIVKATGIDPKLIKVVGHGEKDPIASNSTKEGRAQNRRVEVELKAPQVEKALPVEKERTGEEAPPSGKGEAPSEAPKPKGPPPAPTHSSDKDKALDEIQQENSNKENPTAPQAQPEPEKPVAPRTEQPKEPAPNPPYEPDANPDWDISDPNDPRNVPPVAAKPEAPPVTEPAKQPEPEPRQDDKAVRAIEEENIENLQQVSFTPGMEASIEPFKDNLRELCDGTVRSALTDRTGRSLVGRFDPESQTGALLVIDSGTQEVLGKYEFDLKGEKPEVTAYTNTNVKPDQQGDLMLGELASNLYYEQVEGRLPTAKEALTRSQEELADSLYLRSQQGEVVTKNHNDQGDGMRESYQVEPRQGGGFTVTRSKQEFYDFGPTGDPTVETVEYNESGVRLDRPRQGGYTLEEQVNRYMQDKEILALLQQE